MVADTTYAFTLPRGYADAEGTVHRDGEMRLATALDEIAPLRDPRVLANPAYLVIILLARVITRLGGLPDVNPGVVERLYAVDLAYLEERYRQLNEDGAGVLAVNCPHCSEAFDVELSRLGG
jgi:hypothetical protein